MCYAHGSIDQAVHVCPMCRVFPHPRCPHQRDVCRNRALHPRFDVSYLKNAEVESFNGCGYCKWARTNPPPKLAGYFNHGWPGCCRPPIISEYRLIQPADWKSVSIVHQVPVPPDIKAAFDIIGKRGSPTPAGARSSTSNHARAATISTSDRKTSFNASPTKQAATLGRSFSSSKPKSGSPKQIYSVLNTPNLSPNLSRSSSATAISSSLPNSSPLDHQRRQSSERRVDGMHSSNSSPKRKDVDLESSATSRRNSSSKGPSVTPSTTSVSVSKVVVDSRNQSAQRRPSLVSSHSPIKSSFSPRLNDRTVASSLRPAKKDDISSASSSSGSSDGILSDSTITSDGAFTDYLSDESEAELQRQAEARAALLAQMQAEELEFKAVRQQLAHIDLRPPKSWNPTTINSVTRLSKDATIAYSQRPALIPITHTAQT